jgi:hypothetical protein
MRKKGKMGGMLSSRQTINKTPNRTDRQYKRATQDIFRIFNYRTDLIDRLCPLIIESKRK